MENLFFQKVKARTLFSTDEYGACMDCDEEHILLIEFKKGGKHFGHSFFPDNAFVFPENDESHDNSVYPVG